MSRFGVTTVNSKESASDDHFQVSWLQGPKNQKKFTFKDILNYSGEGFIKVFWLLDKSGEEAEVVELLHPLLRRSELAVEAGAVGVANVVLEVERGQAVEFFVVHHSVGFPGSGAASLERMQLPSVW